MSKNDTSNMKGRCSVHDYSAPGIYHITLAVTESLGQPLGRVVGDFLQEDGQPNAPHVELSAIGRMVEEELLKSIPAHYLPLGIRICSSCDRKQAVSLRDHRASRHQLRAGLSAGDNRCNCRCRYRSRPCLSRLSFRTPY